MSDDDDAAAWHARTLEKQEEQEAHENASRAAWEEAYWAARSAITAARLAGDTPANPHPPTDWLHEVWRCADDHIAHEQEGL